MIRWIEDQMLSFLQRRCKHPDEMIASDILEGSVDGIEVKYCRRCGSIKTDWRADQSTYRKFMLLEHFWRRPDPNLWRG